MKIKEAISPTYLIIEYKTGRWVKRQLEFILERKDTKTEILIKYIYPSAEPFMSIIGEDKTARSLLKASSDAQRLKLERLFQRLKSRLGATEVSRVDKTKEATEREIVREKEVIVKIRCPYCAKTYDETLDSCPHCGGKR